MGRVRTLRGLLNHTEVRRLIMDDGQPTHGHIVRAFYAFPQRADTATNDVQATLALDEDGAVIDWNAGDNRQIGWAATGIGSSREVNAPFTVIDPDHVVVRDLWIYGAGSASGQINYLIVLEEVAITEDQAVLALIKERSQDDL